MKKKELRRRIAELESLPKRPDDLVPPPLDFDVMTICFSDKTVDWGGRRVTVDSNCVSIPFSSHQPFYFPLRYLPEPR